MTRLIYLLAIIIISCNSSNNNNQNESRHTDSTQKTVNLADSNNTSSSVDSIDRANANTIAAAKDEVNKAMVSLKDSLLLVSTDKFHDHRFFGYSRPDSHSRRLILFSIFTNDVQGNPYHLPYGSYYQTNDMDNVQLKYLATEGAFVKFTILKNNTPQDTIYIEKKWIDFEN